MQGAEASLVGRQTSNVGCKSERDFVAQCCEIGAAETSRQTSDIRPQTTHYLGQPSLTAAARP